MYKKPDCQPFGRLLFLALIAVIVIIIITHQSLIAKQKLLHIPAGRPAMSADF